MIGVRPLFSGCLAHNTAHEIAQAMSDVLAEQQYIFVAVNEMFGWRPEVRTGLVLREPIEVSHFGDDSQFVHVPFNDQDYICSISTQALTQQAAYDLRVDSFDLVRVTIYPSQVQIEHRVPAGGKLYWTLVPTGPVPVEDSE